MTTIQRTEPRESERLRRSAAATAQGPTDEQRDLGSQHFSSLLASVRDAQDPTNVDFPFLRRMRRDHIVAMADYLVKMPLVRTSYYFEADDVRAAAAADNVLRPIYGSLMLTILRILWAGFSPAVKNMQAVNPSWTYIVDGQRKRVWDSQIVDALVYTQPTPLKPESCRLAYDSRGKWNGILWDEYYSGRGGFYVGGQLKPQIDLAHSIWAINDYESEDGSPYGFARIAHCAPFFHGYRYIWTLGFRGFENNADPGPIVGYPDDEGTLSEGSENNQDIALRVGRSARSGSTIAKPSKPYSNYANDRTTAMQQWTIEWPKHATDFDAIMKFMNYLDIGKFRGMLVMEQSATEGEGGSSSRNVAESMSSQRDASQAVLMQQVIDNVIMPQIIRPWFAMNMPWYEGKLDMRTLGFGREDEDMIRQAFQLAGQQDLTRFGIDFRRLAESKGFPMQDLEEFRKELERREQRGAQDASNSLGPVVEPTQGQRAYRTQTGFGEMTYHQVHDPIDARSREDGDFVASLPLDEFASPWRDREAVDAARLLRAAAQRFLDRSRRDLEILVSKQGRGEALDEAERASVVDQWLPRQGRVDEFSETAQRAFSLVQSDHPAALLDVRARGLADRLSEHVRHDVLAGTSTSTVVASAHAKDEIAASCALARIGRAEVDDVHWLQLDDGSIVEREELDEVWPVLPLPGAPEDLQIRRERLDGEHLARYDEGTRTVLLSDQITPEQEREFMLALGQRWLSKP